MIRITSLNENDLNRIVRRVISEEEDRSMTTQMFNTAKQKYDNGQRNPSLEKKIKNCITKNRLKSLFWLTTARGAYILGLIAVGFLIPGLDGVEVGALAAIYIIYVIASERNIIENNISNDVKKLCDCLF
jgi:hypothetical protein